MYSRISKTLLLLLLSACQADGSGKAEGEAIACAIGAGSEMAPVCAVERGHDEAGPLLTIRQPDGGFRRLRSVAGVWDAADGAFAAVTADAGNGQMEVAVEGDRYLLPGPQAAKELAH
ncbi:hypothetical protein [Sphingobium phenoxybenzoativorans]|uniref:hypothetical protein n=1 Tax=Sphingobium phenoxybenzoativorans TaxID=1592790 RepID=UPI0008734272|nr:hypothetical protein [Sphingobium phenoxybenzoativorans]